MRVRFPLVGFALAVLACGPLAPSMAWAQEEPILYPTKGQSPEQQEKDKYECYSWAKKQTGFDPMQGGANGGGPPRGVHGPGGGSRRGSGCSGRHRRRSYRGGRRERSGHRRGGRGG